MAHEEEKKPVAADQNLLNVRQSRESVQDLLGKILADTRKKDAAALDVAPTVVTTSPWDQRLENAMLKYATISEALPYPTVNPALLKQRRKLQKNADGWARLAGVSPSSIKWSDNLTTTDMVNIWKQQKNQFVGDLFRASMPTNLSEVNQLAQAANLDQASWLDLIKLHKESRRDVEHEQAVFDYTTAVENRSVSAMIPRIIKSTVKEASAKGELVTRAKVYDMFKEWYDTVEKVQGYQWEALLSKQTIDDAMDTYKAMYPAIEYETWYSPSGAEKEAVIVKDSARKRDLSKAGWTQKEPVQGALGLQHLALPSTQMVSDDRGDLSESYVEALEYFHIPTSMRPGKAVDITIQTSRDQKMANRLRAAGAMKFDPTSPGKEGTLFGPSGAVITRFDFNNPVERQYYQEQALKIGGRVRHVGDVEGAARVAQGRLKEEHKFTLLNSQAQAKDLMKMTDKMRQWIRTGPMDFGLFGSIRAFAQTWLQLGDEGYRLLEKGGILPSREQSLNKANDEIAEIRAAIVRLKTEKAEAKARGDKRDPTIDEAIDTQEFLMDQWRLAKKGGLYGPGASMYPGVAALSEKLGIDANPRLVQIQVYELGMATTLARLRTTKDRLLKDIYTAAREATKMHGFQSAAQALYKMQDIGMQARQKYYEYEARINPTLAERKFDKDKYGHIIPYKRKTEVEKVIGKQDDILTIEELEQKRLEWKKNQ